MPALAAEKEKEKGKGEAAELLLVKARGMWTSQWVSAHTDLGHGQLRRPFLVGIWQHIASGSCKSLSQGSTEEPSRRLSVTIMHPETSPEATRKERMHSWREARTLALRSKVRHYTAKPGHHLIIRTSHGFWTEDRKITLVRNMMPQKYIKCHYIFKMRFKSAVPIFPNMLDALKIFLIPHLDIFLCSTVKSIYLNISLY